MPDLDVSKMDPLLLNDAVKHRMLQNVLELKARLFSVLLIFPIALAALAFTAEGSFLAGIFRGVFISLSAVGVVIVVGLWKDFFLFHRSSYYLLKQNFWIPKNSTVLHADYTILKVSKEPLQGHPFLRDALKTFYCDRCEKTNENAHTVATQEEYEEQSS